MLQNIWYCIRKTALCYYPLLIMCGLAILVNITIPVLATFLPKFVIEQLTDKGDVWQLVWIIGVFMGEIAVLSGVSKFLEKFIYQEKFRMNVHYLKSVVHKGLTTDYVNQEDGTFRRLQNESFNCCNGHSPLTQVYDVLIGLCTSLLGLSVFWTILAKLNVWVILFLVVTTVISYILNRNIIKWTDRNSAERMGYEQRLSYINEISGDARAAKDIRLYPMAEWFSDIYKENMKGIAQWYRRLTKKLFGVSAWDGALGLLREGITYLYLLMLVWNGQIAVADFVLYFGVVTGFSAWLGSLFAQVSVLNQLSVKIKYFREYLDYPETFCREGGVSVRQDSVPGLIELRGVSHRYAEGQEKVLQDINLKIASGEHLAVVGLNGAGKTTLVKIICGLLDPTEGQVLYDGVPVKEYNRVEFYRLFSAVFQQFSIMPVTLEEIVAECPAEQLDSKRVRQCLEIAGLWEKVSQLPQGVKSQYGRTIYDDGIELSGGETQKLLLARAIYKEAPVMLLDEPTAALDPIAESQLYQNYNQMSAGKTTLFISHRLASTSFCHRIILLDKGRIVEEGTHRELLEQKGKYYQLFELQAKYYKEEQDNAVQESGRSEERE